MSSLLRRIIDERMREQEKVRKRQFRENLSVNVWHVGTVNGVAETLSEILAQQ